MSQLPISDHYCVFFSVEGNLSQVRGELITQKWISKALVKFTDMMRLTEPYSYDCFLSTMVEHFIICFKCCCSSSVRISPWLNNVKEAKKSCRAVLIITYIKKHWLLIIKHYIPQERIFFPKIITENSGNSRTLSSIINL